MFDPPSQLIDQLSHYEQQHVLQHWDDLDAQQRKYLVAQLESVDFELIQSVWKQFSEGVPDVRDLSNIAPPNSIRLADETPLSYEKAYHCGEQLLREGRVGVVIVAGGQGSRLGFNHPKGLYPIGPLSDRTLFQFIVDKIAGYEKKCSTQIPLFIMTSPAVHEETVAYFQQQQFFGRQDRVTFFCQSTIPAVDAESGKLLLQARHQLFVSPNGHGGILEAMQSQGILDTCEQRGVDTLFYGQIDNPLSPTCSPALLGYHALGNAQVTLQTIAKQSSCDKTGNIVSVDGRTQIIEYSEIPEALANEVNQDGQLKLWAANIAVHVFQTDFLRAVTRSSNGLPYHFAHKRVAYLDASGTLQQPSNPNAIKFERFIFDLLPLADKTLTVEARREDVFAPVKNAPTESFNTGFTSREGICQLHRRWLQEAGCQVPEGIQVEIHPQYAVNLSQLMQRSDLPEKIDRDTYLQIPPFHSSSSSGN